MIETKDFQARPEIGSQAERALGPPENRTRNAEDWRAAQYEQIKTDLNRFAAVAIAHVRAVKDRADTAREEKVHGFPGLTDRMAANRRAARCSLDLRYDPHGRVLRNSGDGHCQMGFSWDWVRQALNLQSVQFAKALFQTGGKFFSIRTRGSKEENEHVKAMMAPVVELLLARGRSVDCLEQPMARDNGLHGTFVWRYMPAQLLRFRRQGGPDGAYVEERDEFGPLLEAWPLEDVWVSNRAEARPEMQELVIWRKPAQSLRDLETNEATWKWMTVQGARGEPQRIYIAAGAWVNLEPLRVAEYSSTGQPMTGEMDQRKKVSSFPLYTRWEAEGALPLGAWARSGDFTPALAEWLGINVGIDPKQGENALVEWGHRLNRISHWWMAWVEEETAGIAPTVGTGGETLIGFRDSPWAEPGNTLYVTRPVVIDDFYGLGLNDLGRGAARMADLVTNSTLKAMVKNQAGTWAVKKASLRKGTLDEVQRLLHELEAVVELDPASTERIADVVQNFTLPVDGSVAGWIGLFQKAFMNLTGIALGILAGETAQATGTATELRMNQALQEAVLYMTVINAAQELCRMVRRMIMDAQHFLAPEEFKELIVQAAGTDAESVDKYLTAKELEHLEEMFIVAPEVIEFSVSALRTERLKEMFQLGLPVDPEEVVRRIETQSGGTDPNGLLAKGRKPMEAEQEHDQLAAGNWISPHAADNDMLHLAEHRVLGDAVKTALEGALGMVASGQAADEMSALEEIGEIAGGFRGDEICNLRDQLPKHALVHVQMLQMKTQMAQAQAMGMGQGAGQGPRGGASPEANGRGKVGIGESGAAGNNKKAEEGMRRGMGPEIIIGGGYPQ
jgi:hypothetical protein